MSDLCSELTDLITLQLTWRHLNPLNRVVMGKLSLHPLGGSVPSSAIVIVPQKSHCSDWILPILTVQIHNYKWLVCSCNYVLWNSTHAHVDASLHESQPRTKKNMFLRQSVAFKTQKTVSFVANARWSFALEDSEAVCRLCVTLDANSHSSVPSVPPIDRHYGSAALPTLADDDSAQQEPGIGRTPHGSRSVHSNSCRTAILDMNLISDQIWKRLKLLLPLA